MDKYTLHWFFCWIELGLPAWTRLLLALCICLTSGATDADPWEVTTAELWYWGRPLRPSYRGYRWSWALRTLWKSRWHLLVRCGLLLTLIEASGVREAVPGLRYLAGLPLLEGLVNSGACLWGSHRGYPWVQRGARRAYQLSVWGLLVVTGLRGARVTHGLALLGSVETCERDGSWVKLEQRDTADGPPTYHVHLRGEFVLELRSQDPFAQRMFLLFLRQLRTPGREGSSWGIVRQESLARVFGVKQEHISRWQGYLRGGEWARLLSLADSSWLNEDRCREIVDVWARNPWQTADQVRQRLVAQGLQVSRRAVEEAGRRSGLQQVRKHLKQQYVRGAHGVRPREEYVVQQLFRLVEQLEARLRGEERISEEAVDLPSLRQWAGREAEDPPPEKPWPWLRRLEHTLWGAWPEETAGRVRCPYCGTDQVARKSRTPRLKAYVDAHGQRQTVEVYRYYCKNPACSYQTFTDLPPGVVLHSVWTLDARLQGLELYMGLGSSYRKAAAALGIPSATLYRWLEVWGHEALQIAALFGLVRSSGAVGIDEKYVLVPKNPKRPGKYRRWMYVYVAVDLHTLDLLHINVFPYRDQASVRTFLLELRAKGYHPRAVVTDLCPDYPEPLAAVFPQAEHHECLFHALQAWHRQFRELFGRDYAHTHPEMWALREELDRVFRPTTRRTVQKRYQQWRTACEELQEPLLQPIVDSVVRHYPRLINAYERPLIPSTNNATERLIRRFDQHYQNFAGFNSLPSTRGYLHLFELTYRLTPFGQEVQPHLRGRCPLELAGYDLSQVPLARFFREAGKRPLFPEPTEVVPR